MQTKTSPSVLRLATLTLPLFVVLTMALLLLPSVRGFAQGLLREIGGYTFSQGVPEPIDASRLPASITILESSTTTSLEFTSESSVANDLVSADALAGFTVLAPSYLPSGYIFMDDGWHITLEGNSTAVTSGYFDVSKNYFIITQWKVGEGDTTETFTREEIVDVQVRGQDGVWLPDASTNNNTTALVWAENGITYSIISSGLSLTEMVQVAESLAR